MGNESRRWVSLFAGVFIELLAGLPYSWSVFQNLLTEKYGWTVPHTALAYSVASAVMLVFTLFASGPLVKNLGIKRFLILGCFFYGAGTLACGFIKSSLWELYAFYGLGVGLGTAILYPTLTSYAVKIFPDRPGLAGGLMTAGYGCGPFVLAPIIVRIYELSGDVSSVFILLGIFFLIAIFGLCFLIREPNTMASAYTVSTQKDSAAISVYSYTRKEMLKSPLFYVIYFVYAIGIVNATMLLTQASPILRDSFMLTATVSAGFVGAFSLSNTAGRLLCGFFSDKLGKVRTVLCLHILVLISFSMLFFTHNLVFSASALAFCFFCLGGFAALLAPATSEAFGFVSLSENYSVMFSIFTVAGIAGLQIITNIGYRGAYMYGIITTFIGILLSLVYQKLQQRHAGRVTNPLP